MGNGYFGVSFFGGTTLTIGTDVSEARIKKNKTGVVRQWFTRDVACMALLFASGTVSAVTLTNSTGKFTTRGFLGDYTITVTHNNKTTTKTASLPATVEVCLP